MSSSKEILPLPKKLEDDLQSYSNKLYKKDINKKNDLEQTIETTSKQTLTKVLDDSIEKAMYDEIFGSILPKNNNTLSSNNNKVITNNNVNRTSLLDTNTNNIDFNTVIINKLHLVEKESKDLKLIVAELTIKNKNLSNENNILKSLINNNDTNDTNNVTTTNDNNNVTTNNNTNMQSFQIIKELKNRNELLESKIIQMEAFLGDYGLVWVGNHHSQPPPSSSNLDNSDTYNDTINHTQLTLHMISYEDFLLYINELNAVIYSEPAQVVTDTYNLKKASFKQASELVEKIRVIFYRNGLFIKRGPFRLCGTHGYISFMRDIVDGYFPGEFQGDYPNGVIFDLVDKHNNDYILGTSEIDNDSTMSKNQFLNRLPKTIIHKGEVIDMRNDINKLLSGDNNNDSMTNNSSKDNTKKELIHTPALEYIQSKNIITKNTSTNYSTNENSNINTTTNSPLGILVVIQIKWIDQSTLIANMFEHNTINDLKSYLIEHFNTTNNNNTNCKVLQMIDFELRSAYPSKTLNNYLTLSEAKLVPNGTVHARKVF